MAGSIFSSSARRALSPRGRYHDPSSGLCDHDSDVVVGGRTRSVDRDTVISRRGERRDRETLERLIRSVSENPQCDAGLLLDRFGGLRGVLAARPSALSLVVNSDIAGLIRGVRATIDAQALGLIEQRCVIQADRKLARALIDLLGSRTREVLCVLFLDAGNRLISVEMDDKGGATGMSASARSIIGRALELEATAIVLVHNHPGGQAAPSQADASFTSRVHRAGVGLGVTLHDHLIVAGRQCFSMTNKALIS